MDNKTLCDVTSYIDFLRENKINALILDVDNTLIDYDKNLEDGTIEWAQYLKEQGITKHYLNRKIQI